MKSRTMATVIWRRVASAWMASIWVVVGVDEGDPGSAVVGVAAVGLVEGGGDDGRDVVGDAGGQPLAAGVRAGCGGAGLAGAGDDVAGGARARGGVVDAGELGHPLAAVFLSWRQAGRQFAARGPCRLGGGLTQRLGSHHDAFAVKGQYQQVGIWAGGQFPLGVEAGHVGGCGHGERLELALADPDPARAREGGASLLE
jgi:hypothetical protein